MKKLLLLGALAMLPSMAAHADIIPTNDTITGSGPYTWNYHIQVTTDETAFPGPAPAGNPVPRDPPTGAFFTIYDFAGYVAGSCAGPTGWTCTAQNPGFTPDDTIPGDHSAMNITWTYTSGAPIVGEQFLSGFSAISTIGPNNAAPVSFTARATKNTGPTAGTFIDNVGLVIAPVPEPASLSLLGLAFAGLAFRRRKA